MGRDILVKAVKEATTAVADTVVKPKVTKPPFQPNAVKAVGDSFQHSTTNSDISTEAIRQSVERLRFILKNRLSKLDDGSRMINPSNIILRVGDKDLCMAYQVDRTNPNKIKIIIKDSLDRGDWDEAVPYRTSLEMIMDQSGQMTWGRLFEGNDLRFYSKQCPCSTEFTRSDKNKRCITVGSVNYRPIANSENWGVVENTVTSRDQAVSLAKSEHPFGKLFFELTGLKARIN